nr:hypothetical protein [Lachnospiraceae bacterium]
MKKTTEKIVYAVVAIVFVAAFTMLFTVQARSRAAEAVLFDNRSFEVSEQAYKEQVETVLDSYGLYHSGLTMTRVVSMDGKREYALVIYNSRISRLEEKEYCSLEADLSRCAVVLPDGNVLSVDVSLSGCMS